MTTTWSRRQQLCAAVLLLLIGPLLVAVHPSIPFMNDEFCDAWYVFGLFYHLPDALRWLLREGGPAPYQVARLSNLIPGYVLTRLFSGIAADYAMFFLYYSASVFFFYRSIRTLIGEKVALFAAIFFAVHPLIIANYSVTYASAGILYSILSLFFVARAIDAKSSVGEMGLLFASGTAMGAALHVHMGVVVYGVANYLTYLFCVLMYSSEAIRARIWHLAQAGCAVLAGVAALTAALGGLAVLFGGSFSLVFQQFSYLHYEFSSAAQEWTVPYWYLHGGIGGMFVATLLLSALNVYLCQSSFGRLTLPERVRRRVAALSWAILAMTVICLLYGGIDQRDFYYVFLVPYLSAVVFTPLVFVKMERWRSTIALAVVFLACGLAASGLNEHFVGWLHRVPIEAVASLAAALGAVLIYGYLALSRRAGAGVVVSYAIAVVLMLIIVRPDETAILIWKVPRDLRFAREYQRIRAGLAWLDTIHFENSPQFWIDMKSGPSELYAYSPAYLSCNFQRSFPAINSTSWVSDDPNKAPSQFVPGQDVVVVSRAPDLGAVAERAFAALGLEVERVADFGVYSRGTGYEFLVEHVQGLEGRNEIPLPLASFRPINEATVSLPADGLLLTTAPGQWSYSLIEPLRYPLGNTNGPVGLRIRFRVDEGAIGLAVSSRGNISHLIRRMDKIEAAKDQQEVCLYIPDASAADLLIIQNESPNGASRAELRSAELFRVNSQTPAAARETSKCYINHP